jgi:competence protein ComEA
VKNKIKIAVLTVLLAAVFLNGCGQTGLIASEEVQSYSASKDTENGEESEDSASDEEDIYVDITGAVVNPGVYQLKQGDRVYQAIEKAGGFTEDAVESALNQASLLEDGQQIVVQTYSEQEEQAQEAAKSGLVNINTADETELCTLPGIGESKAKSIISYREKNGPFTSTEQLTEISGIKEGVFEKISDMVCVN